MADVPEHMDHVFVAIISLSPPWISEAVIFFFSLSTLWNVLKEKTRLLQLQTDYFGGVPARPLHNRKPARLLGCTARPFISPEQKPHCPHSDGGPLGSAFLVLRNLHAAANQP